MTVPCGFTSIGLPIGLQIVGTAFGESRVLALGHAMPILPYCHEVWAVLKKPFVHGLGNNQLERKQFKYAWIDTNRRPQ
jgi:hypothetical protein